MKKTISALMFCVMLLFSGCKSSEQTSEPLSPASDPKPAITSSDNGFDSNPTQTSAPTTTEPKLDLTTTSAENSFEVNPPFFKVEDAQTGAVVYMLGSMHVGKPEATYSQKLVDALDECDTLAVEVDIQALETNISEAGKAMAVLLCPAGKTASDYMGEDYDEIVRKFTEKGLYNPVYDLYIPALWSSLWSSQAAEDCGYDSSLGTDMLLLTYAKEHGKKIDEIETAKEQYQVEAGCSPELQMTMLKQTIELSQSDMQEQFDILYDSWKSGDIDALKALLNDEDPSEALNDGDYQRYYNAMYVNRQQKMADYVMSKLQTGGKTFVVVGAMHYAAPPSIIDVLEENGYTIETLSAAA